MLNIVIGLFEGVALAFGFTQMVISFFRFVDMLNVNLLSRGFFKALRGRLKRFRPIWILQAIAPAVIVLVFAPTGSLFHFEEASGFDAPALARVGGGTMVIALIASISYLSNSPRLSKKMDMGEWRFGRL